MKYLRYVTMMLIALVATASFAQQAPELTPVHRAAIVYLLKALHTGPLAVTALHSGIVSAAAGDRDAEAFAEDMLGEIKQEEVIERLIPIYAKYLSSDEAIEVAHFYESPTGLKFVSSISNQVKAGGKIEVPSLPSLTPADKTNLVNFAQSRAGRKMLDAQKSVNEDAKRMFVDWTKEILAARMKQASSIMAGDGGRMNSAGGQLTLFDRIAIMYRDGRLEMLEDQKRFRDDVAKLKLDTLLLPQNLIAKESIEDSKVKINALSDALDHYLHAVDDLHEKLKRQADALGIPAQFKAEFMRRMDVSLAKNYDDEIRFSENQRNIIEISTRILDFAEARIGKFTVRDNKLIFSDNADLEIYRSLYAQLKVESQRGDELIAEARSTPQSNKNQTTAANEKNQVAVATEKNQTYVPLDKGQTPVSVEKNQTATLIADSDVRAVYDREIAKLKGKQQYHVAHILLKSEAEANATLSSIENGTRFEDAAKSSLDNTGKTGGDLGWAFPDSFVPSFADAVRSMTAAGLYPRSIKSPFGWHVMRVLEIRPAPIPTLEQARPYIEKQLRAQQSK